MINEHSSMDEVVNHFQSLAEAAGHMILSTSEDILQSEHIPGEVEKCVEIIKSLATKREILYAQAQAAADAGFAGRNPAIAAADRFWEFPRQKLIFAKLIEE